MEIDQKLTYEIITELPTNVTESILACLPLRDAVRTSILSSQWRYKWITLPQLTIDDRCIVTSSSDATVIKSKLINFIDRLLLLHKGPIETFQLSSANLQSCSDIDQWMLFLSRNGIKKFILHIQKGERHKVPSCLFSCKQLNHLGLNGFIFKFPPTFDGFNYLTSLNLQLITFVGCTCESLISSCPLLERLVLSQFDGFIDIKIRAPNLKYLYLSGLFKSLCFENTPLLADATFVLTQYIEEAGNDEHLECRTSNLTKFFGYLAGIEKLDVWIYFLKFLGVRNVSNKLPNALNHLKKLGLFTVTFNDLDEFAVALCLIKNAPKLQLLKISAFLDDKYAEMGPTLKFLETQDSLDYSLNQLRVVNITDISGQRTELEFIKFLLVNTPVLETMTVQINKKKVAKIGSRMLKKLLRFRRASPKAEIEYLDS